MSIKERIMKRSTEDRTQGKIHVVKGAIKEAAGKVTNDPDLEAEGNVEKISGKIQGVIGRVEKAAGA
jgi:uncharacterized protein YjbJ (UPF0337 family)